MLHWLGSAQLLDLQTVLDTLRTHIGAATSASIVRRIRIESLKY